MIDYWLLFRFKLGKWMLCTSMDVMPRCDLRDDLRVSIVHAFAANVGED